MTKPSDELPASSFCSESDAGLAAHAIRNVLALTGLPSAGDNPVPFQVLMPILLYILTSCVPHDQQAVGNRHIIVEKGDMQGQECLTLHLFLLLAYIYWLFL